MVKDSNPKHPADDAQAASPLEQLHSSLQALLEDKSVPAEVREALQPEYQELAQTLEKLEQKHIHIAVFGRVSVGKSSLLNGLIGEPRFAVSPLHGETKRAEFSDSVESSDGSVFFIDTPGIDEIDGEAREQAAREMAERCDLLLFVVEGDMTATEYDYLKAVADSRRPTLLVLNKSDRYTREEQDQLLAKLRNATTEWLHPDNIVLTSADPAERIVISIDDSGNETEQRRKPPPEVRALKDRLWLILEREGKALAALNAGLFAARVSSSVTKRIMEVKQRTAEKLINKYCLAKGVSVAVNPVPLADLAAAAALDVTLVYHLSRVYGLPMTRAESGKLVATISAQLALLMGAVWAINLASSLIKTLSLGLSVAVTAVGQGAVAWYATLLVGRAATDYLENGASWGEGGAKVAVQKVLDSLDRDSILNEAKDELRRRLKQ